MKKVLIFIFAIILGFVSDVHAYNVEVVFCKKWDATSIAVDTNWLSSSCASQNSRSPVRQTLQIVCPTTTVVEIVLTSTRSDASAELAKTIEVNGGLALPANGLHQHAFIVTPGDVWDIKHKTGDQNCTLQVFESTDLSL